MSWIIGILTVILVINCVLLILLILVQLPKKEAGLGTAFGGGTTDALFGAGTGNVLTKLTKYSTVAFFVITLSLSVMNAHQNQSKKSSLEDALKSLETEEVEEAVSTTAPPATNEGPSALTTTITNTLMTATNLVVPPAKAPEGTGAEPPKVPTPETEPPPKNP